MRTHRPRTLLLVLLLALASAGPATAQETQDVPDATATSSLSATLRLISFGNDLPESVFARIFATGEPVDLEIFAQDCCIRDDVVEVYVHRVDVQPRPEPCLLATIDSRGGATGTHAGERHKVSLGPGAYQIEYRMTISEPGASDWSVSEESQPFTNKFSCLCPSIQRERIQDFDVAIEGPQRICSQDSEGPRTPNWGPGLGELPVLEFETGEKLEIVCQSARFEYLYTPPAGPRRLVGFCPFEGGTNTIEFQHFGDVDKNGKPECLLTTRWISRDYGRNDTPNPFTKEERETLLDWAVLFFDVRSGLRFDQSIQYAYAQQPPIRFKVGDPEPEGELVRARLLGGTDKGSGQLAAVPGTGADLSLDEPEPMVIEAFRPCDLTSDGSCDEADFERFRSALGACFGDAAYRPLADANGDNCVDEADGGQLFGLIVDVKPGSAVNHVNPQSNGALHVAVLASDFGPNPALLDPDAFTFGATGTEASPDKFDYEDADGDGDFDLVLRFHTRATGLQCGDTVAWLAGATGDGKPVASFDRVTTVGCPRL